MSDFASYLQNKKQKDDAIDQLRISEAVFNANVPIHSKKGRNIHKGWFNKKLRLIRAFFTRQTDTLYLRLKARKEARKKKDKKAV